MFVLFNLTPKYSVPPALPAALPAGLNWEFKFINFSIVEFER